MLNEEEKIANYVRTSVFTLIMLSIGVIFGPEWAIIGLLSIIYMKNG